MDATDAHAIDEAMMRRCFALGLKSVEQGEYPYGSVIVRNGEILTEATNRVAHDLDITRHAEIVAISAAQKALGSTSLDGCTLYTNVEPCALCSYAIRESRIARVVYAMASPIMGGASRWDILNDRELSDRMPEVFAPPPDLLRDFMAEEALASLRRSSPATWAFLWSRGLIGDDPAPMASEQPSAGPAGIIGWLMRMLRKNFFDRFGRGGPS
jgi:tRNA(adenine34) deaminase